MKKLLTFKEHIVKVGSKFRLVSKSSGKNLGTYDTKEGAESMLLGGVTGGLMQIGGNFAERAKINANTQAFATILNSTPSFKQAFHDRMDAINRGVILQQHHWRAPKKPQRIPRKH